MTPAAQSSLGEIPEKFIEYWLSRFPYLLSHVWCAMQKFRFEPTLKTYYHPVYEFAYEVDNQNNSTIQNVDTISTPVWRIHNSVDWSPNKIRFRMQRRKPEDKRKKIEEPITWALPPSS